MRLVGVINIHLSDSSGTLPVDGDRCPLLQPELLSREFCCLMGAWIQDIGEDAAEAYPAPRGRLRKMCGLLLNEVGALMTKNMEKIKILNVFFTLVFTGKICL